MLKGLKNALNATGYPFAEWAWSEKPKGDYGTFHIDDQAQLRADADAGAECIPRGYIDLYTRDFTCAPQEAVENALRELGIWWTLESVQFDVNFGGVHFEWRWADTNGAASADPEA